MKQSLLIFSALLFSSLGFSQGEGNNWYFGNKAGISFSGNTPVSLLDGQLNAFEGCTSISDNQGNLLFYTNGLTVWNKNHLPMPNGAGLFGGWSSSQAAIVAKKPGSETIYYIFTTNAAQSNSGLRYSIVDMSLNSGLGNVTSKNVLLYEPTCEKISVVNHSNGTDVWVVTHEFGTNGFYAHLLTASGLSPLSVLSNSGLVTNNSDEGNAIGYLKISPDGSKIAACHTYMNQAELFDFNSTTGVVSNPQTVLAEGMHPYGAEFSQSGNALYISALDEKQLYRFDLNAADVAQSKTLVANFQQLPGALQMGPDGKIYIAMSENEKLTVINDPDNNATQCNMQSNSIDLQGRMGYLGLPSFNQSLFNNYIEAENSCGSTANFTLHTSMGVSAVNWDFGDATTGTGVSVSHTYATAGTYTITATAVISSGIITKSKTITVAAPTVANPIANQSVCFLQHETIALSENDAALLGSQSASDYGTAYFTSATNAQNHTNLMPAQFYLSQATTTVYAKVFLLTNVNCYALTSFTITGKLKPSDELITSLEICDDAPFDGYAAFDLTVKNAEILGNQSSNDFSISYYANVDDADNAVNPIIGLYTNTSNPQTVYARVDNSNGCNVLIPFHLTVNDCGVVEAFDYPKFFTPNGDGYNDVWEIKADPNFPDMKVTVFDRYGKLLKIMTATDNTWNGSFNGQMLTSSDYWFVATGSNGREFRGHFSMKR